MTSPDDVRIVGDAMLGALLASASRLLLLKGLLEPAAAWLGRRGWKHLDAATGDRLPDLFR